MPTFFDTDILFTDKVYQNLKIYVPILCRPRRKVNIHTNGPKNAGNDGIEIKIGRYVFWYGKDDGDVNILKL